MRSDESGVSAFYRRAEDILEIATAGDGRLGDSVLVLDRQGGLRIMEAAGWSFPALAAEFGAEAIYKIERRGGKVRVEGWDGSRRCLLQSETSRGKLPSLLGWAPVGQALLVSAGY